jgi:hypothetical protein
MDVASCSSDKHLNFFWSQRERGAVSINSNFFVALEVQNKRSALCWLAFSPNSALMAVNDSLHHRKPNSRALNSFIECRP